MRFSRCVVGYAGDRQVSLAVSRVHAHRHRPLWLHRDHAGQARQLVARALAARLDEVDRDILAFRVPELREDQPLDRLEKTKPTIRMATAKAMPKIEAAARNGWRLDVAQDHAPGGAQAARHEPASR